MQHGPADRTTHRFGFIPNLLTLLRMVIAAAFPFVAMHWRPILLVIALLTEVADGWLARRYGWESALGRLLDPVADKLLFGAVALTLLFERQLSWPTLLALGMRDACVALGALWIVLRGQRQVLAGMAPRWAGKLTTGLQYLVLLGIVFGIAPPWPLVAATFLCGALAAVQYAAQASAGLRQAPSLRRR